MQHDSLSLGQQIYHLATLFYGPRDQFPGIFYIKERSPLFPPSFPPMRGQQIGKGSYYETQSVDLLEDRVIVSLKIYVTPFSDTSSPFTIDQVDIFTWDDCGTIHVLVDYPDGQGGTLAQTQGQLTEYSEDQWVFDFRSVEIPCPPLPDEPWKHQVNSCQFRVQHTDTLIYTDINLKTTIYSYDLLYIAFLDAQGNLLGTQKIPPEDVGLIVNPFVASSSNPHAWDAGV